jgi:hypothetical protein
MMALALVWLGGAGQSCYWVPERPGLRFASRFIQHLDMLDGYGRDKELAEEFRRRALRVEPRA